jgi:acyl dehydratase
MKDYYYDSWIEDGTSPLGYREVGSFKPVKTRTRKFADIAEGQDLPVIVQGPITRTDIVKYAGASWDFNPFHHDETFAKRSRAGGIIAHGMMVMGYLGRVATAFLGISEFDRFTARFKSVTHAGDTLRLEGHVKQTTAQSTGGVVVLALRALNQRGELVAEGEVSATLSN